MVLVCILTKTTSKQTAIRNIQNGVVLSYKYVKQNMQFDKKKYLDLLEVRFISFHLYSQSYFALINYSINI